MSFLVFLDLLSKIKILLIGLFLLDGHGLNFKELIILLLLLAKELLSSVNSDILLSPIDILDFT